MKVNHRRLAAVAVALALGVSACGDDGDDATAGGSGGGGDKGSTLTIYSSMPLQGDSRPQSEDIVRGIEMAIDKVGGKAGGHTIKYVSLDDATASTGKWEPGQVSSNARKAVGDESAIAYIGEFNSGASAVSIPLINEAGILQVSPSNTYVGLTRAEGAETGEPEKYYPTGKRTFGRVVPADHLQAGALVAYQQEEQCTKTYLLNDKEVYGKGLADQVEKIAADRGLDVAGNDGIDTKAANFRALAEKVDDSGADCFVFAGITQNKAIQVFKDVFAANPNLKMFGPDGLAESAFTEKLGARLEKNVFITNPTLDAKFYPPSAQEFIDEFKAKHGKTPELYAIYGYEAAQVVLEAIEAAGDKAAGSPEGRKAVVDAFFATKGRSGLLGTYDIDENGDTTLTDYGSYRVKDGKLVFDQVVKGA
jgi:branched-chain amino acid transport system substrate-binding protein